MHTQEQRSVVRQANPGIGDRITLRGAARLGPWLITWPFASLSVSRPEIVVRALWSNDVARRDAGDQLAIVDRAIERGVKVRFSDGTLGDIVFACSAERLGAVLRHFDWDDPFVAHG